MEQYKIDFINFMIDCQVLKFGDFTLKSGRKSPFFMNAGAYITGSQLAQLGKYYAQAIHDNFGDDFDVLFGPAYKGIPLSVATVIAYNELYGKEIRYCSNRKEAKDHGDVEDVTTSGKSIEETYPIVKAQGDVTIVGEIVSLDRMEKALDSEKSALSVITEKYGFPARAIVTMEDVIQALYTEGDKKYITPQIKEQIDEYYKLYGAQK